jgi:hypothetical protein
MKINVPLGSLDWIAEKYIVLSSIGTSRKVIPFPTKLRNLFLKLWPSWKVVKPRAAHKGKNLTGFKPKNFATTEFAPSQPINTYSDHKCRRCICVCKIFGFVDHVVLLKR